MYNDDFINCLTKYGVPCFTPDGQIINKNNIWNNDLKLIWGKLNKSMKDEIIECWHEQNKYEQNIINNILEEMSIKNKKQLNMKTGKEIILDYCENVQTGDIDHLQACIDIKELLRKNEDDRIYLISRCPSSFGLNYIGLCEINDIGFYEEQCKECWDKALNIEQYAYGEQMGYQKGYHEGYTDGFNKAIIILQNELEKGLSLKSLKIKLNKEECDKILKEINNFK